MTNVSDIVERVVSLVLEGEDWGGGVSLVGHE